MNFSERIISVLFCSACMAFLPLNAISQADTSSYAVPSKVTDSPHSLYTSLGYGSNMIYLGSTLSGNQSYGYGSLVYGFKDALYASISAVHLENTNPFVSFY